MYHFHISPYSTCIIMSICKYIHTYTCTHIHIYIYSKIMYFIANCTFAAIANDICVMNLHQ